MDKTHGKIPMDPVENLKQMEGILDHWKAARDRQEQQCELLKKKLVEHQAKVLPEDAPAQLVEGRAILERKLNFDIDETRKEIKRLKGRIFWAEKRQIPFIKSEIARKKALDEANAAVGDAPAAPAAE